MGKQRKEHLTHAELRARLRYDPDTGTFVRYTTGRAVGTLDKDGYVRVRFQCRDYSGHRLAWFYQTGSWPREIDHRNGERSDNRWGNLREVTREENAQNIRAGRGRSKLLGAHARAGGYEAKIRVKGRTQYIGFFGSASQAHAAYVAAKRKFHKGCTI